MHGLQMFASLLLPLNHEACVVGGKALFPFAPSTWKHFSEVDLVCSFSTNVQQGLLFPPVAPRPHMHHAIEPWMAQVGLAALSQSSKI